MAEVVLEGVSKSFPPPRRRHDPRKQCVGLTTAVRNLSLTVKDSELVVLVGPSGSGKTTVLRLIAGLECPDEGTIRLGGRVVNDAPARQRNIAMVFQNYALYPHLSVFKNLAFGLEMRRKENWLRRERGYERSKIQDRVRQTAQMLGIEGLLDRRPGQLSGGERQRVALGRAMVRSAEAFLLDEPLANLDAPLRIELRRELKELHRRSESAMLYVTHDQVEALALGDRIGVMDRGQLQQIGAPQEVYDHPRNRFVAGFFGSAGMNFVAGRFISGDKGIQFQSPGVTFPLSPPSDPQSRPYSGSFADYVGRPVVLGVRPEDVLLRQAGDADSGKDLAARGCVSLVEFAGDALLIHLEVDSNASPGAEVGARAPAISPRIISKAEANAAVRQGDVRDVVFRRSRVHWFDGQTGERLAACPTASAPGGAQHQKYDESD